jgi:hypothetical protein
MRFFIRSLSALPGHHPGKSPRRISSESIAEFLRVLLQDDCDFIGGFLVRHVLAARRHRSPIPSLTWHTEDAPPKVHCACFR